MEAYNEKEHQEESKVMQLYEKGRSFLTAWLGVILTLVAMVVIFIVAALEGTKEVKASNSDSGKIMNIWRQSAGVEEGFPEENTAFVNYKNKEYYFVVSKYNDENEVIKWYWAYDGGLDYIFHDYKYYVLVGLTLVFSIFVSIVNYNSTLDSVFETSKFKKSLGYYQEKKSAISQYTQYIPLYCSYKNKQAYEDKKREFVEDANINWETYNSKEFNIKVLERWQKRKLRKIRRIKILRMRSSDLLQEQSFSTRKVRMLPEGPTEHKTKFILIGSVQKLITTAMSGLIAGFGIIIGNWPMGLVFAGTIIMSHISSIVTAADYGMNTLRQRFIGKGDHLLEFNNMKERFIKEEEAAIKAKKEAEEKKVRNVSENQTETPITHVSNFSNNMLVPINK